MNGLSSSRSAWKATFGVICGLIGAGLVNATEVTNRFEPACLPWEQARYEASKLFMSVQLDISARILDALPADALKPVADGRVGLPAGASTLEFAVSVQGPGWRTLDGRLLVDAPSGQVLQYASLRQPSPRYRVYRFTDTGPQRLTARPVDDEADLPPEDWTDIDIKQRYYSMPSSQPVLEVSTLLYLLAASELDAPGDALQLDGYATSADALYAVTATVGQPEQLAVDYRIHEIGESTTRRGVVTVLPIRVAAGAGSSEGFDILGLQDVEFLMDPVERTIVALRAWVPALGSVQFQLHSLGLRPGMRAACKAARRGA